MVKNGYHENANSFVAGLLKIGREVLRRTVAVNPNIAVVELHKCVNINRCHKTSGRGLCFAAACVALKVSEAYCVERGIKAKNGDELKNFVLLACAASRESTEEILTAMYTPSSSGTTETSKATIHKTVSRGRERSVSVDRQNQWPEASAKFQALRRSANEIKRRRVGDVVD
jgi:hypothetical protein